MIASLMMYLRPELDEVYRRFWRQLREFLAHQGIDSPPQLAQDAEEFSVWKNPDLVLSQTCGMPYRLWLHEQVALVGTLDYGLESCPPGYYRSALVVRRDDLRVDLVDFRDARFAYNQVFSQSGYAAPFTHASARGFWFHDRLKTGQHQLSARAVAERKADIASLDAVSWRLMRAFESFSDDLRVLEWTEPTPGLPLITAKTNDPEKIHAAVKHTIDSLTDADRSALGLKGIVYIPMQEYLAVPGPP